MTDAIRRLLATTAKAWNIPKQGMKTALTLCEVAELTGFSYSTIFARKNELGAFRVFDRKNGHWRVWPESIENLYKKRKNVTCMGLQVDNVGNKQCQSIKHPTRPIGGFISSRQAAKELGALLAQRTGKRPLSTTTS